MAKRPARVLSKTDLLAEGLREMFAPEAALAEPTPLDVPYTYKPRQEKEPTLIAQKFAELNPDEQPPVEIMMHEISMVYDVFFEAVFAERDAATDQPILPYIDFSYSAEEGWFAIHFRPYAEYQEGQNTVKRYDPDLDNQLQAMFDELYMRADAGLRVWSAPNTFCKKLEYVLHTHNPFLFINPLKSMIKDSGQITQTDLETAMLGREAKALDASEAFNSDAEYAQYRSARHAHVRRNTVREQRVILADPQMAAECLNEMPMRPYMSHTEAVMASFQVRRGEVLSFSIAGVEAVIYECLGLDAPATPEFNAYKMN